MTLDALLQFLRGGIKMSHIYQPFLIRTLLDNGGACTRRQLAIALLMQDESQIEYYEKRLREMPLPVLKKRGVISETNGVVGLELDKLSLQERASIRLECDSLIQKFIVERGMRIWDHRMIDDDPVPDSIRYQVLKRDRRCVLCKVPKEDAPLHVDHIVPRSKGGLNTLAIFKPSALSATAVRITKDDTDFRDAGLPPRSPI
jgi:ATP adenylyltransferase